MIWTLPPPAVASASAGPLLAPAYAISEPPPNALALPAGAGRNDANVVPTAKPDIAPTPPSRQGLKLGVTVRGRYDLRFNDAGASGNRRTSNHLSFDTVAFTANYDSSHFFGSAQYRFYGGNFIYGKSAGYHEYPGEVNFLMYGYGGVKLTAKDSVTVGVQAVPFDDRYWGSSILDDLAFVYGMEETYDLGVKFRRATPAYRIEIGFFPGSGPDGMGISRDAARYSTNIAKADAYVPDGSNNDERDMIIGNASYTLAAHDDVKLTATVSGWISTIRNLDTHRNGDKHVFAASLTGNSGQWHAKTLVARQDIDPRNPGRDDLITVGGFDASYNIAAKGTYVFAEIGRSLDTGRLPFDVVPYVNYGRFFKDTSGFRDSERVDIGAVWTSKGAKRIKIYSELLLGRNDPYVGADQFVSGAAQGGDNKLKTALMVIFGYSF